MASALSSIPSGVSASCTPFMSSGSSIIELIWVFLGARHCAWKCPSLPQLKHFHGRGCCHEGFSTCAALLRVCPCLGACARLLVSIGTSMLRIHGVTAALTATPSSDLITQVESFRDEQEVLLWYCCLQHSQAARGVGERKLRFTRDSECRIQARSVAYLYPYELG